MTFSVGVPRLDPHALRAPVRPATPRIPTQDELGLLLSAAKKASPTLPVRGPVLHAMIGLAACTGLRIGEVLRIHRQDVDLKNALLTIRRTKSRQRKGSPGPYTPDDAGGAPRIGLLRDAPSRRRRSGPSSSQHQRKAVRRADPRVGDARPRPPHGASRSRKEGASFP